MAGVTFTRDAAERIGAATLAYERGNRDQSPIRFRQGGDDGGDPVRLGKTAEKWSKGTLATIDVWESGTPPSETQTTDEQIDKCVNKFADVDAGKWVMVAKAGNGHWYLIAAECG